MGKIKKTLGVVGGIALASVVVGGATFMTLKFDDVKKVVSGPVYSQSEVDEKVEEEGQNKYDEGKQEGLEQGFDEGINYMPGLSVDISEIGINGEVDFVNLNNGDVLLGCPNSSFKGVYLIDKATKTTTKIIENGGYWHFQILENGNVLITANGGYGGNTYIYNSQTKVAEQRYYETSFSKANINANYIFEVGNGQYLLTESVGTEMYLYDSIEDTFTLLGGYASSYKPQVLKDGSLLMVCSQSNKYGLYKISLEDKSFIKIYDGMYFRYGYETEDGCLIGGQNGYSASGLLFYNYEDQTVKQIATNNCGYSTFYKLDDGSVLCGSYEFGIFKDGQFTKLGGNSSWESDLSHETDDFIFFSSSTATSYGVYAFDKSDKTLKKIADTGNDFSFIEIGDYMFLLSPYDYLSKINYFDLKTKESKTYGSNNYYNSYKTENGLLISAKKGSISSSKGCVYFDLKTATFKEIINFGIDFTFKLDKENHVLIENEKYVFQFDEATQTSILKNYKTL